MQFCSTCGRELQHGASFCSKCGASVVVLTQAVQSSQQAKPASGTLELWEKVERIMGKSREARLITLGVLLMVVGGGGFFPLNAVGIYSPLSALLFVFGILSFITGFGLYVDKTEKRSARRQRAKKTKKQDLGWQGEWTGELLVDGLSVTTQLTSELSP
jgi:hypothetical protein